MVNRCCVTAVGLLTRMKYSAVLAPTNCAAARISCKWKCSFSLRKYDIFGQTKTEERVQLSEQSDAPQTRKNVA